MNIVELKLLKESENKVEFKEAKNQYAYNSSRKSVLGYTVAFANEKGGYLVLGLKDVHPHDVCGSKAFEGREGQLEQDVYRDLGIRIDTEVLYEGDKRVLVIHIPSRPVGKSLKFEDVPLMRVGEELLPMSDDKFFKILQEQEPDFSATICSGLTITNLDEFAIAKMKEAYAIKQKNPAFLSLSNEQVLSDLKLLKGKNLNFAALVLLARKEIISEKLPQAKIIWEFRNTEAQIHHDFRETIEEPLFIGIDKIWQLIHQRNSKYPIQSDAYIFDLYAFNEEVIREAILNALAHRDYTITSEVVIKQYPKKIILNNPGGFPKGVTIDNLLTVSSTPRSRLMTEILEKTGLVERSGQGVDKIYSITLSEGKAEPDYKDSDLYQVTLKLSGEIKDKAFHVFINQYQKKNPDSPLGVEQIISLFRIKQGFVPLVNQEIILQLERTGLIKRESGHTNKYLLHDTYYQYANEQGKISNRYMINEVEHILQVLQNNSLKMGSLESSLKGSMNRNQIKYSLQKLAEDLIVKREGSGRGTKYSLSDQFSDLSGEPLFVKVIQELRAKYQG
ncbi:MAG TPA: ATP-binding protein [Paludibacter sp.]